MKGGIVMKDKSLEKKNRELVIKKLSELLMPYGFVKTKPTFYTRLHKDRIEFIHLHKFTFAPSFRVHIGIRFLIDNLDFVALNGIEANGYKNEYPINYNFRYHKDDNSIVRCANQILLFVENEAPPWLDIWRDQDTLFTRQDSPLREELVHQYKLFKDETNNNDLVLITQSKKLLGIKQ